MLLSLSRLKARLQSKKQKIRIYNTITLPIVLYGRHTWSLTRKGEYNFRTFENKVLWRIFGPKGDEFNREWWQQYGRELHALYSSPYIVRIMKSQRLRRAGTVPRMGESEATFSVLVFL